jgi:hypothetical protein
VVGVGAGCPVGSEARASGRRPQRWRGGVRWRQAVPGHDGFIPVGVCACGGARGWLQRPKISMMRMRPPQQGQGGVGPGASIGSAGSNGGSTANNSRARLMLALRVVLASSP